MKNSGEQSLNKITILAGGGGGKALLRSLCIQRVTEGEDLTQPPDTLINGVTTTSDSGGSSGDLMNRFDIPPVGDAGKQIGAGIPDEYVQGIFLHRHTLERSEVKPSDSCNNVANKLSASEIYYDEHLLESIQGNTRILETELGNNLSGHTNSNIYIAARILDGGRSFADSLNDVQRAFGSRVNVHPITNERMKLVMYDGNECIDGEHKFDERSIRNPDKVKLRYEAVFPVTSGAKQAIEDSTVAITGLGSFYGSVLAIINHPGIREALRNQQKLGGKLFAMTNLISDPRETKGWDGDKCIDKLVEALGDIKLHGAIANNNLAVFPMRLRQQAIRPPSEAIWEKRGIRVHLGRLAAKNQAGSHDPIATASAIRQMAIVS